MTLLSSVTCTRYAENPLITPAMVPPSRPDFEVVCAFNAGVAQYGDETLLLLRVAERPIVEPGMAKVPVVVGDADDSHLEILAFSTTDPTIDCSDPRCIETPQGVYLTTLSHLRLARSTGGRQFTIDPAPAIFPQGPTEAFGLEDPRITQIGEDYYIAYKAVSPRGPCVSLVVTRDFVIYKRLGIIFHPENLDVCIFPEQVNGRFVALHRPVPKNFSSHSMWVAYSPDLRHWGDHQYLMGPRAGLWDAGRIGGSAIPIKTDQGWLEIYHGATREDVYCLGAVLLDLDQPHRVIARGELPIMRPEAEYETQGFLPNVLFSCGAIAHGDRISVYYGAADEMMAGADFSLAEILESLAPLAAVVS